MSTFAENFLVGSRKSKQRGTITISIGNTSATATITSVNTAKADLAYLGTSGNVSSTEGRSALVRIALTNSTTITATRAPSATSGDVDVGWELTEFN